MSVDHYENFPVASIHYLLEPGALMRTDFIVDNPKVAHNTYLNVLAELGRTPVLAESATLRGLANAAGGQSTNCEKLNRNTAFT